MPARACLAHLHTPCCALLSRMNMHEGLGCCWAVGNGGPLFSAKHSLCGSQCTSLPCPPARGSMGAQRVGALEQGYSERGSNKVALHRENASLEHSHDFLLAKYIPFSCLCCRNQVPTRVWGLHCRVRPRHSRNEIQVHVGHPGQAQRVH